MKTETPKKVQEAKLKPSEVLTEKQLEASSFTEFDRYFNDKQTGKPFVLKECGLTVMVSTPDVAKLALAGNLPTGLLKEAIDGDRAKVLALMDSNPENMKKLLAFTDEFFIAAVVFPKFAKEGNIPEKIYPVEMVPMSDKLSLLNLLQSGADKLKSFRKGR